MLDFIHGQQSVRIWSTFCGLQSISHQSDTMVSAAQRVSSCRHFLVLPYCHKDPLYIRHL